MLTQEKECLMMTRREWIRQGSRVGAGLEGPEVKAVLTWGASDRNTWLNNTNKAHKVHPDRRERPLPFDENYAPTATFFAMRECFDKAKKR